MAKVYYSDMLRPSQILGGNHRIRVQASLSSPPPLRVPRSTSPPVAKRSSIYNQGQCVSLSTQGSPLETQLRAGHLGTLCPTHSKIHTSWGGAAGKVFRSNCVLCANHPGTVNHPINGLLGEPGSQTSQGPTLEAGLSEDSSL